MDAPAARNRVRNIIDSEATAFYIDDEIDAFLAMATDEFIQQYYAAFETSQDSRDKLQDLVISKDVDLIDATPAEIGTFDANDTYGRFLSAYVKASPNVNVKVIQIGDIGAYLNDPFNKADVSNPVIYFKGGNIHSIGLPTATPCVITYLQHSTDFTDLNATTHEEICQITARKILATLGDARYQAVQAEIAERRV
jgi:hypothetical protein